jgi:predicted secreted hydrolase
MRRARPSVLGACLPALAWGWSGCCPDASYELLAPAPTVRLPGDEEPHCSGGEWWYYTGTLTADDGRDYGVETVIFHAPPAVLRLPINAWVAHFAVLDTTTGAFVYDQDRSLGPRIIDWPGDEGFDLYTPLVQMNGLSGRDHVYASMSDGSYIIDLDLEDLRGPVLHGGSGYIPYGTDGWSFYYSRPRMQAAGTLQVDGQTYQVAGDFWFDRQWGRDLRDPRIAWDWFSLRLDDGADVMLFVFRDMQVPSVSGTYMPAEGDPVPLAAEDVVILPTRWWASPHTGRSYPVGWSIQVSSQELALEVSAVADDQELDVSSTTFNVYWEGLCEVTGARAGQQVTGSAFVELTNYP